MNSIITLLIIAVALVYAGDDLSLGGFFHAQQGVASWQTVEVSNILSGQNLTNSVDDVTLVVNENSNAVFISYPYGSRSQVGNIVAGASGWGQFRVVALSSGRYTVVVTARYRKDGAADYSYQSKIFFLWVGDSEKRSEPTVVYDNSEEHEFEARQPGNEDADITPTSFYAEDSITTWNSFDIHAGNNNLNNVTFTIVPDDLSVLIGYPPGGNYVVQIMKNTTYDTDISISGNPGVYNFNCSITYRKGANINFRTFWIIRQCFIDGDTTSTSTVRLASAKALNTNNEGGLIRSDVALAVAVGGIALVAAVAVVSAMVIIRKKQDSTSV